MVLEPKVGTARDSVTPAPPHGPPTNKAGSLMGRDAFKIWRGFIRDELVSLPWEEKGMSGSQGWGVPAWEAHP